MADLYNTECGECGECEECKKCQKCEECNGLIGDSPSDEVCFECIENITLCPHCYKNDVVSGSGICVECKSKHPGKNPPPLPPRYL